MHYTIGQSIVVSESVPTGPGPKSITALPMKRKLNSPFATNQGDYIGLQFPDTAAADKCIAEALGETLPDYSAFYNRSKT